MGKHITANATRTYSWPSLALFLSVLPVSSWAQSALNSQWQHYILQELQSAVGLVPTTAPQAISSTESLIRSALQREISAALQLSDGKQFQIELRDGSTGNYEMSGLGLLRQAYGYSAGRQIAPAFVQNFAGGEFEIGAVISYESFSANGLGVREFDEFASGTDVSTGSAIQLGWGKELASGLSISSAYRSKMSMDAFQNYRGLFSEPGRFDAPARISTKLSYKLGERSAIGVSVQRLEYAATKPFSSRLLPDRFVSLLGDNASPNFEWENLTLYRAGLDQGFGRNSVVSLSVSSTLQPSPTSALLRNALSNTRDYTVSLGVEQRFSKAASLKFGATYMPFSYFLGPSLLSAENDYSGSNIEAEALFEVRF
jgi:hypothetical protein